MKIENVDWKLFAQWIAVSVLGSFLLSTFLVTLIWYIKDEFVLRKAVGLFLMLLWMLIFLISVIFISLRKNKIEFERNGLNDEGPIVLSHENSSVKKEFYKMCCGLMSFGLICFIAFFFVDIFEDSHIEEIALMLSAVGFIGFPLFVLYAIKNESSLKRRWIVDHDGIRYESSVERPIVMKWEEVEKIKHEGRMLRKGDDIFRLPRLPGLDRETARAYHRIRDNLNDRFEIDSKDHLLLHPWRVFFNCVFFSIIGAVVILGWLAFSISHEYQSFWVMGVMWLMVYLIALPFLIKQERWQAPIDRSQ